MTYVFARYAAIGSLGGRPNYVQIVFLQLTGASPEVCLRELFPSGHIVICIALYSALTVSRLCTMGFVIRHTSVLAMLTCDVTPCRSLAAKHYQV